VSFISLVNSDHSGKGKTVLFTRGSLHFIVNYLRGHRLLLHSQYRARSREMKINYKGKCINGQERKSVRQEKDVKDTIIMKKREDGGVATRRKTRRGYVGTSGDKWSAGY